MYGIFFIIAQKKDIFVKSRQLGNLVWNQCWIIIQLTKLKHFPKFVCWNVCSYRAHIAAIVTLVYEELMKILEYHIFIYSYFFRLFLKAPLGQQNIKPLTILTVCAGPSWRCAGTRPCSDVTCWVVLTQANHWATLSKETIIACCNVKCQMSSCTNRH